jgi:hypothetical protein
MFISALGANELKNIRRNSSKLSIWFNDKRHHRYKRTKRKDLSIQNPCVSRVSEKLYIGQVSQKSDIRQVTEKSGMGQIADKHLVSALYLPPRREIVCYATSCKPLPLRGTPTGQGG